MSTNITHTAQPTLVKNQMPDVFSLKDLIAALSSLEAAPTLEDLNAWLREVYVSRDEICPYVGFKPGTYARHRVFRNDFTELLVLCWQPGQRTPIHDHNGSFGAVRVYEGVMWETCFALDDAHVLCYQSGRDWKSGQVTAANVPDIHQIGNPEISGQNLITLHLYAPPLSVLNTYRVGSATVGRYTPDEFMDGAGI